MNGNDHHQIGAPITSKTMRKSVDGQPSSETPLIQRRNVQGANDGWASGSQAAGSGMRPALEPDRLELAKRIKRKRSQHEAMLRRIDEEVIATGRASQASQRQTV